MYLFGNLFISMLLSGTLVINSDSIPAELPANHICDVESSDYEVNPSINDNVKIDNLKFTFKFRLFFETGSTIINDSVKNKIIDFADTLNVNPKLRIALIGHTDNTGYLERNKFLSLNRAKAVADFLISKNVAISQFSLIEGRFSSEPIAQNTTPIGRSLNRRVDVYLVEKFPFEDKNERNSTTQKVKELPASLKKIVNKIIKQKDNANEVDVEIDGLLVDDTKTKTGKDFYDLFYSGWEPPKSAKDYTITVTERPFRLTSTLIIVSINDNPVYQAVLQPRQDIIESLTENAIATTQSYLANYEEIIKQLNGDDLSGSGIY